MVRGATTRPTWVGKLAAVGLAMAVPACGGDPGQLPVYPVKGEVRLNNEPTEGAFLVFHPVSGDATRGDKKTGEPLRPSAQVKADGSYLLTTYTEGDGAPAGDYAVTVEWRKLVKKEGDVSAGPNVIPNEYARPESTPWKVTVKTDSSNQVEPRRIDKKKMRR